MIVCKNIPAYSDIHDLITLPDYDKISMKKYDYYTHLSVGGMYMGYYGRRDEGGAEKMALMYNELNGKFFVIPYYAVAELDIFIEYTKIM